MSRRLVSRRLTPSCMLVLALSLLTAASTAVGQQSQLAPRGPRFLLAGWVPGREVDASAAPVLRRRVSLDLTGVTIGEALKEVTRQAALEISYSPRVVPLDRPVSLHAQDITVAAALTEILLDVPVDVSVTEGGGLALVRRLPPAVAPEAIDSGAVAGQVTDSASGTPIAGATVIIDGARRSAVTDAGGRYRIGALAPGTYTVRVRYIGYQPSRVLITVGAGKETTADLTLRKSAQELDQVVVTGTVVPTEVRALPTPVSVIDEGDIALQRPQTVQEVFRRAVPGAVSWVYSENPYDTPLSVRGASSLNTSSPSMKVFVDGVEMATAGYAQIDPQSIARIEVIRGPQAAAIYGSEAIGGVVQVFTKRGDPGLTRPQVNAEAALGLVQTPYEGRSEVLRQEYKASVRGGGSDIGYNVGAGYSHQGDWLPAGEISRQSSPSVYGAMTFARGIISVDLSGRHYTQNGAININPDLLETGFVPFSKPNYEPLKFQNQTLGARLSVRPRPWWGSAIKVGLDRYSTDVAQTRPRLTTPADTLFLVSNTVQTKTSIGGTTSVQGDLGTSVSGSLTVGFDHWNNVLSDWLAFGALTTTGALQTSPDGFTAGTRNITNNTGYFAQTQLGFREVLFLTGGLRAEDNSDFGDSLGTPISPRVGLAYVQSVGQATVKLRSSWGRAIRAPSPGQKQGFVRANSAQLPNADLGPERQHGWDVGIDATIGSRGSVAVTYYDQTAENLVDAVQVETDPVPTQQFQNVGRVRNTGVEVEARVALGRVTLQGQYAYSRARVDQLSPTYAGELQVGDQARMRPKHTAGATITVTPLATTTLSAGVTYVGSWINSDALALFRCLGGTGPCFPTSRDYLVAYPGLVKANVSLFHQVSSVVSGFVSVDNLTNNKRHEGTNFTAVSGRRTTAGLRFEY
jgi:outer membrane receptor protein involved in Fe transport